jgi:hypothetical protein
MSGINLGAASRGRKKMASSLKELEESARALSPEDRAKLAEVEAEWAQEIGRRVAAFEKGELTGYPAEDVFAEARRLLR